ALAANASPKADCCANDGAAAPAKTISCCGTPKNDDCCAGGDPLVLLNGLGDRAAKLETLWSTTVPKAFTSLPAADKTALEQALAGGVKLDPRRPAMVETIGVLREFASTESCCSGGDKACDAKPEQKAVVDLLAARTELRKKTLAVLDAMTKMCGGPASSCCA